jgi:mRNA interferase MazF
MRRGEIRWYTFASPDKRRPVLILARELVARDLNEIIVVPATRTVRALSTEVLLTPDDGMPVVCALNFDHIALAQRSRLGAVIATLPPTRWPDAMRALLIACGFEPLGT